MAPHADQDVQVAGVTDTTSVVMPDPILSKNATRLADRSSLSPRFSIDDILPHRQQSASMPPGVAAFASADMFKSKSNNTKPKARRWDHHITPESAMRKPSSLKAAMKYFNKNVISLCGGLPSSDYFPFQEMSLKIPTVPQFSESDSIKTGQQVSAGKHDVPEGKSLYDLSIALNYGQSMGPPQLMRFVTEHTEIVHNPPYADWDICMTVGSTSAFDCALRMLCERGDTILTEEYSFSSAIETMLPMGLVPVGIKMDSDGLLATDMDKILSNWDESVRGEKKPRVLYTIPTGHNPTASTQPLERRKAIYAVAEKHDIIILEDEPYYFLQMETYIPGTTHGVPQSFGPVSTSEFLSNLVPSYLSLDTSGRVVRLESFSKTIAPGSRTGWVTASHQLIERFVRHQEVSSQTPSGFALMALYKLLEESWGHSGFLAWLGYIRAEYTRRRDIICNACTEFLPKGVCSWVAPKAGMFHWITVDASRHPKLATGSAALEEIEEAIFLAAVKENVLVARGSWFRAEKDNKIDPSSSSSPSSLPEPLSDDSRLYFRMTFAAASGEQIVEAVRRFGVALKTEFGI